MSGGESHICGLRTDGTIACWGDNTYGQRDGIPAGTFTQLSVGLYHGCALATDGSLQCWGNNNWGQTNVPAGTFTQVSAGFEHTCAARSDGSLVCWGRNDSGQCDVPADLAEQKAAPVITAISLPAAPIALGTAASLSASFTDENVSDTHTASINWEGTTTTGSLTEPTLTAAGTVSGSYTYPSAGVYTIGVSITDAGGLSGSRSSVLDIPSYIVIYDPSAGFVTGGGWIDSPAGACKLSTCASDGSTVGKASFGFVSRYTNGATTPSGNTEFQFKAGGLHFKSSSYEWLVVSGSRAQYKGEGTINGGGSYGFLITAIDGALISGGGTDKFRIKIWDQASGTVVYDNQMDTAEDGDAATALGGGSIVIHK